MLHDPGPSPGWFSGKDEGVEGESARQRMEQALAAAPSAGTQPQESSSTFAEMLKFLEILTASNAKIDSIDD